MVNESLDENDKPMIPVDVAAQNVTRNFSRNDE